MTHALSVFLPTLIDSARISLLKILFSVRNCSLQCICCEADNKDFPANPSAVLNSLNLKTILKKQTLRISV